MLPLGDAWTGVCRAAPDQPFQPEPALLDPFCNFGYARGHCAHFPAALAPDAARFTILSDDGAALRLYYVLERDHRPYAYGPLSFSVERSVNGSGFTPIAAVPPKIITGTVTYTDSTVAGGNQYRYRVKAVNGIGSSAYTNTVTITIPAVPNAPSNAAVSVVRGVVNDTVTLRWADNSTNNTSFLIQRSTSASFTNPTSYTAGANAVTLSQTVPRRLTYYYRIQAVNGTVASSWVVFTPSPIVMP